MIKKYKYFVFANCNIITIVCSIPSVHFSDFFLVGNRLYGSLKYAIIGDIKV